MYIVLSNGLSFDLVPNRLNINVSPQFYDEFMPMLSQFYEDSLMILR